MKITLHICFFSYAYLWVFNPFLCFIIVCYFDKSVSLWLCIASMRAKQLFVFKEQQNLGRKFGTYKPPAV